MNSLLLSPGQLRTLADRCGVPIVRESPLGALLDVAPAPLDDLQTTSPWPLWRDALACVAEPRGRVRIVTPGAAATKNAAFYVAAGGDLVGLWPEANGIHLSFPWKSAQIATAAGEVLMADLPWPADPFSATLSPAGLAMLAAAVDDLKARRLAALLNRQPDNGEAPLRQEDLRRQWQLGCSAADGRWLVTLLHTVTPTAARGGDDASAAGLAELSDRGLLRRQGDAWLPTDPLQRLVAAWSVPLPAITHEAVLMSNGQPVDYRCALAIRGEGPLWLIEFLGVLTDKPQIALRSLTGRDYVSWLREKHLEINLPASSAAKSASAPQKAPAATLCPSCGVALVGAAKFCANCGRPTTVEQPQPAVAAILVNPTPVPEPTFPPRLPERARSAPAAVSPPAAAPPPVNETSSRPAPPPSAPKREPPVATPAPAAPVPPPKRDAQPAAPAPATAQQRCTNPDCGQPIAPGKIFCPNCGTAASAAPASARRCTNPGCQQLVPANKRFCTHCGTACPQ